MLGELSRRLAVELRELLDLLRPDPGLPRLLPQRVALRRERAPLDVGGALRGGDGVELLRQPADGLAQLLLPRLDEVERALRLRPQRAAAPRLDIPTQTVGAVRYLAREAGSQRSVGSIANLANISARTWAYLTTTST